MDYTILISWATTPRGYQFRARTETQSRIMRTNRTVIYALMSHARMRPIRENTKESMLTD